MPDTKWTPGPWEVSGGYVMPVDTDDLAPTGPVPDGVRASGTMFAIALVYAPTKWRDGNGQEVQEANARLIASAPDLLAALQKIAGGKEVEDPYHPEQTITVCWSAEEIDGICQDAIAKAEGR